MKMTYKLTHKHFCAWYHQEFYCYGTEQAQMIPAFKWFFELSDEELSDLSWKDDYDPQASLMWFIKTMLLQIEFMEYGTSPRSAWFKAQGLLLQEYFKTHSVDEILKALDFEAHEVTGFGGDITTPYGRYCSDGQCSCPPNKKQPAFNCENPLFWTINNANYLSKDPATWTWMTPASGDIILC